MEVKTYQRSDLRWVYSIDGKDSENTYPTCGEAERGAWAAIRDANRPSDAWKWWMVLAAIVIPVLWFLSHLIRMLLQ